MAEDDGWRLGHRPWLDQLRAVAVLAVLWGHSIRSGPFRWGSGGVGVAVFFTLSGFLITRLMIEEKNRTGRLDVRAFYGRRVRRLLPPLPLAFGVCIVFAVALGDDWVQPLGNALTYSINYSDGYRSTFSHLWSLAVEEHFYLAWPLFVAVLPPRRIATVALVVALAGTMLEMIVAPVDLQATQTQFHLAGLLFGAAAATFVERGWRPSRPMTVCAWAVLGLFCLPDSAAMRETWGMTAVSMAALAVMFSKLDSVRRRPRLERIGAISYGIYLFHFPLALALRVEGLNEGVALLLVTVFSITLAELSFRLIEQPVVRRRSGSGVVGPRPREHVGPFLRGEGGRLQPHEGDVEPQPA